MIDYLNESTDRFGVGKTGFRTSRRYYDSEQWERILELTNPSNHPDWENDEEILKEVQDLYKQLDPTTTYSLTDIPIIVENVITGEKNHYENVKAVAKEFDVTEVYVKNLSFTGKVSESGLFKDLKVTRVLKKD